MQGAAAFVVALFFALPFFCYLLNKITNKYRYEKIFRHPDIPPSYRRHQRFRTGQPASESSKCSKEGSHDSCRIGNRCNRSIFRCDFNTIDFIRRKIKFVHINGRYRAKGQLQSRILCKCRRQQPC